MSDTTNHEYLNEIVKQGAPDLVEDIKHTTDTPVDYLLIEHQLKYCSTIISKLKKNPNSYPFLEPVDPIKLGIPDYPLMIKHPMDISTIKKKLDTKVYQSIREYNSDMKLMFNNCYTFNHPDSEVCKMCRNLEMFYDDCYKNMPMEIGRKRRRMESIPDRSKHLKRVIRHGDTMKIEDYEFCVEVLSEVLKTKHKNITWPFYERVDEHLVPQYYEIIKNPICLKDIKDKLDNKMYATVEEFSDDLKLIVQNCHTYNEKHTDVYNCGNDLNTLIIDLLSKYEPKDIKGRILELKKKISQYTKEIKTLESRMKDRTDMPTRAYSLNERIDLGNRILNLNKQHTDQVARIIQKHSAGEYVENNEIEVDLRILPDNVFEKIEEYVSRVEIGMEDNQNEEE